MMPTTWEFMGIGEKPEPATIVVDAGNDDYRIGYGSLASSLKPSTKGKSTVWSSHTERVAIRPDSRSAHGQSNR